MGWIDAALVTAFVCYALFSGFRSQKQASSSEEDYFLAGRTLSGWSAGFSMAATQFAVDTPLVVVGLVATSGVFALWRLWIYGIAFFLLAFLMSAWWWRAKVVTDAEFSELRYSGTAASALRATKAVYFGIIFNCVVLAMVLLSATRFTEVFLFWDQWLPTGLFSVVFSVVEALGVPLTVQAEPCSVTCAASCVNDMCMTSHAWTMSTNNVISLTLILAITLLYSTSGGLRAVVRTDVAQFAMAMVATLVMAWVILDRVGGFSGLKEQLVTLYPDGMGRMGHSAITAMTPDLAWDASAAVLGIIGLQWFCQIDADGTGYLAQRSMACRSEKDARLAGVVFTVSQVFFRSIVWLPIAVGLLVVFPMQASDSIAIREATFVRGVSELMPPGVKGLMLAGMFGALASTLDTHLNWGGSYVARDLIGRFLLREEPSERVKVWIARGSAFVVLGFALLVLPFLTSIQEAWQASLLLGAGVGPILVLRWLWWRINAWSELSALVASAVCAVLVLRFVESDATRLFICASVSTAVAVGLALVVRQSDTRRASLKHFAERVRPAGSWSAILDPSPPRRALVIPLLKTFLASAALFSCLIGTGIWVVSTSAPWPFPSTTIAGFVWNGLGLGLLTVFLKLPNAPS